MKIYIPSYRRSEIAATHKSIPKEWLKHTYFVVSKDEMKNYVAVHPNILGLKEVGIGHVRDEIVRAHIKKFGAEPLVMMDDDLSFGVRRTDDPGKFLPASKEDMLKLLKTLQNVLKVYAHAGVATREGGNRNTADYVENTRILRILGYQPDVFRATGAKFSNMKLMEDFDVTLTLLRKGYKNCLINSYIQGQPGSNTKGGCSEYRNLELQKEAAYELAKRHHPFVKVTEKTTKSSWGGTTRTDVVIQWKKAYESSLTK